MKYIPFIIILISFITGSEELELTDARIIQDDIRGDAFGVLRTKCNTCHATKRKTDVFTKANMDSFAVDIHKQVFVKQKMPKGRKVKLTEEELETLERWLELTLAKK